MEPSNPTVGFVVSVVQGASRWVPPTEESFIRDNGATPAVGQLDRTVYAPETQQSDGAGHRAREIGSTV